MLSQQEDFKPGERCPETCEFFCAACDGLKVETTLTVEAAQPMPLCPACKAAGRNEIDQLWIRVRDRADWRKRADTRWRGFWS